MKKRMVVLTKSSKYGKYCVAGIDLQDGTWVRLVTDDEESHGAVSNVDLWDNIKGRVAERLDVIDAPVLGQCNDSLQPENVLLNRKEKIEIVGEMQLDDVLKIHPAESKPNILGNNYACIIADRAQSIGYSLILVSVEDLVIFQKENPSGEPKTKAEFIYHGIKFENMSVTDSKFYSADDGVKYEKATLVISIGAPYNGKCYKFVATIYV